MDMQSFIRSIYTDATANIERLEAAIKVETNSEKRESLQAELARQKLTLKSF